MSRARVLLAAVAVVSVAALAVGWRLSSARAGDPAVSADPVRGQALYAANCAACHGANLEGQPDWRTAGPDGILPAPPHDKTGHTWHHGDALLFGYIKLGGAGSMREMGVDNFKSGMPGFGESLTDGDIWDILAYLKSTWPEDARQYQAERTRDEQLQGE